MVKVLFKNGSTIKINDDIDGNVRGGRAKAFDPYCQDAPFMDKKAVDDVIRKFLGDERPVNPEVDKDIYLSSRWTKEELEVDEDGV